MEALLFAAEGVYAGGVNLLPESLLAGLLEFAEEEDVETNLAFRAALASGRWPNVQRILVAF